MIDPPPCSAMCRAASRVPAITPSTLTAHHPVELGEVLVEHALRCIGLDPPALLTMTCNPPNFSTAVVTSVADLVESRDVGVDEVARRPPTSAASAAPELVLHVGDHHLGALGDESLATMPLPIPAAPPVTIATLPCQFVTHLAGCPFSSRPPRKSSSSSLTASGRSICGQWPARVDDGRAAVRRSARRFRPPSPSGSSLSPAPSTTSVGTAMRSYARSLDGVGGGSRPGLRKRAAAIASHAPGAMLDSWRRGTYVVVVGVGRIEEQRLDDPAHARSVAS